MVWAAVGTPGIIGPIFIEGNVSGASYLKLLTDDFYPAFSSLPNASEHLLQQDGAPPHWAQCVRDWLNENLPNSWIGRGGSSDTNIAWPPRSPDLTIMDFYVWGDVKSKVYARNYANLDELKNSITAAFREVTAEKISASLRNLRRRLELVVKFGGGHVE